VTDRRLEQHEVDELIRGLREGSVPSAETGLSRLRDVESIDFTDPHWGQDRIVRRRLPVLDMVYDRLGPLMQITLTKSLRFPVRTENEGVELQKFGDFRSQYAGTPCLFEIMRLDPLRGFSVIIFEPTMLYALIDALMGGLGIGDRPGDRDISDIEVGLLNKVMTDLLRDVENAWKPWFPLQCEHVRSDRNVNVLSTLSDDEVCHIATVMISGDVLPRVPVHFIHPYSSMEPLLEATSARVGDEVDPNWRVNLESHLREVEAELHAVLGRTMVPGQQLTRLAPGDVFELDRKTDEDIDITVEGEPLFTARMGRSGQQYGVKISQRREVERAMVDRTVGQVLVRKGLISHEQLQVARVDELVNRRPILDSIVARGWAERRVLENAVG
jgi:flagellar motor switch protein FliM